MGMATGKTCGFGGGLIPRIDMSLYHTPKTGIAPLDKLIDEALNQTWGRVEGAITTGLAGLVYTAALRIEDGPIVDNGISEGGLCF